MIEHVKPNMAALPGGWEPDPTDIPTFDESSLTRSIKMFPEIGGPIIGGAFSMAMYIDGLLSSKDCESLISLMEKSDSFQEVSVHGRPDVDVNSIGSSRTTMWSPELASKIWKKIESFSPIALDVRTFEDTTPTDWWQDGHHKHWKAVEVSPLLRFMRYDADGEHYAHYDAGYLYPDGEHRTLLSMVIYLTTNDEGGKTRFINDNQSEIPVWERNHEDWFRRAAVEEVIAEVEPVQGRILLFDHRICHDVERYFGSTPRVIIRGDIIYKKEYTK